MPASSALRFWWVKIHNMLERNFLNHLCCLRSSRVRVRHLLLESWAARGVGGPAWTTSRCRVPGPGLRLLPRPAGRGRTLRGGCWVRVVEKPAAQYPGRSARRGGHVGGAPACLPGISARGEQEAPHRPGHPGRATAHAAWRGAHCRADGGFTAGSVDRSPGLRWPWGSVL